MKHKVKKVTLTETDKFEGVPFTAKDSTACQGLSNTFGLVSRRGETAKEDADVVVCMKNAGAILLGVTNVPQLNMWQETHNPVYGITKNPYNTSRNVGGSSGGEAALIAACGTPMGIGTDIGGSARIPAFSCGIFGHKPTCDLISLKGLTFRTGKEQGSMVTAGPMVKRAVDIAPMLKVLLGSNVSKLKLDDEVDVSKITIYYVIDPQDPFVSPISNEMKKLLLKVVDHFAGISAEPPQELKLENLKYGGMLWRYWLLKELYPGFLSDIKNREEEANLYVEIIKFILRQSEFTCATIFNLINYLLPHPKEEWAKKLTYELKTDILAKLEPNNVLIYPSAPWPASYHHTPLLRPWNMYYMSIWNALKMPVTQVPLGLNSEGLPVGIQVVGAPFQDHICIAVAKELEKAFGGYVPPFVVDI